MSLTPADVSRAAVHLAAMLDVPPCDWWRFAPCAYCNAHRGQPCVQGYAGWPAPAREPHAPRVRSARVLHGTVWLLMNHPEDVMSLEDA